jgi:glutamate dehydrogenase (NADP+)
MQKLTELGGKVVTASDSEGYIHDPDGIRDEKWAWLRELKEVRRGRIREYAEKFGAKFYEGRTPWGVPCDLAFPCATQNELNGDDARTLIKNGLIGVAEGANMPSTLDAVHAFLDKKILFGPAKAANAGGVGVSGLEQSQNSLRIAWSRSEVDERLKTIMSEIHDKCVQYGRSSDGWTNYVQGANLAGFVKVADAMLAYGVV